MLHGRAHLAGRPPLRLRELLDPLGDVALTRLTGCRVAASLHFRPVEALKPAVLLDVSRTPVEHADAAGRLALQQAPNQVLNVI